MPTIEEFFINFIDHFEEYFNSVLSHSIFILFFVRDLFKFFALPKVTENLKSLIKEFIEKLFNYQKDKEMIGLLFK